ncbi:COG3650 family protein [Asticcacaulis endophyticus]|uniref:Membrane protein n=1 Tax=Asticcacaulis endophyticus TaxID=1395890 RepID=A0A918QBQ2_9CAUL|nr:hypothetical protein [Asticcacaulis endophyticus]GGZ41129.1 membrane protein [Asticcacaulis endophyticus]
MQHMGYLAIALICLTACSPASTDTAPAEDNSEPASAPAKVSALPAHSLNGVDLDQPLTLLGTEPFWSVTASPSGIVFKRPDEADITLSAAPFTAMADTAELRHDELTMTLTATTCSDGMSDRAYPLTAQVTYKGKIMQGCAAPTSDLQADRP